MSASQTITIKDEALLSSKLGQALKADEALYDFHFIVGEERQQLPAVKAVVAAFSAPLRSMLYDAKFQHCNGEVELLQWTANAFSVMLSFMHAGNTETDIALLPELLQLSNYLQVSELESRCEELLMANLSLHNILEVWTVAAKLNAESLVWKCKEFFSANATAIIEDTRFQDAPIELMLDVLRDDALPVEEWCVYQVVKKLCQQRRQQNGDTGFASELINTRLTACVRLELLSGQQLALVRKDGLFTADALSDATLNKTTNSNMPQPRIFSNRFNELAKGKSVTLSQDGRTASFSGEPDQCVLGDHPLSKSVTYWEVSVHDAEGIYIGIVDKSIVDVDQTFMVGTGVMFKGHAIVHKFEQGKKAYGIYGEFVGQGDRVGVLVDYPRGCISFSVNGQPLGVELDNFEPTCAYWPCVGCHKGTLELLVAAWPEQMD